MVELQRSRSQRISRNFAANNAGKALIKIPVTAVKGDTFRVFRNGTLLVSVDKFYA
ncbi:MAG: hypothetical protein IPP42_02070 [Saprospiraceae bacterium]|nr:hypothetical protein [Saprospiraceae bacterium]